METPKMKSGNDAESSLRRKTRTPPQTPPRQNKSGTDGVKDDGRKKGETHGSSSLDQRHSTNHSSSSSQRYAEGAGRNAGINHQSNVPSAANQHFSSEGSQQYAQRGLRESGINTRTSYQSIVSPPAIQHIASGHGYQRPPYAGGQHGTSVDLENMEVDQGHVSNLASQYEVRPAGKPSTGERGWGDKIKSGFNTAISHISGFGRRQQENTKNLKGQEYGGDTHNVAFQGNPNLQHAQLQMNFGSAGNAPPPDPLDRLHGKDFICYDFSVSMNKTYKGYVVRPEFSWKLRNIPLRTERQDFNISISSLNCRPLVDENPATKISRYTVLNNVIQCGKLYVFKVSFYVVSERHSRFSESEFKFCTIPGKPSDLVLSSKQEHARLKWSACEGAQQIEVKVYSLSDELLQTFPALGSDTSCQITYDGNIAMGNYCKIQVIAFCDVVDNKSDKKTFFIGDRDCPRSVKADLTKSTNKVKVSWKPPDSAVKQYKVKAECPGQKSIEKYTKDTDIEFDELNAGSTYTFFVQAAFRVLSSYWIPSNSITTVSCDIEVKNFDAERNPNDPGTSIICEWAENTGAEKYKIKCSSDKHESISVVTIGTSFTIQNLYPDTKYKVKIRAKEVRGYGEYGAPVEVTTDMGRIYHPHISLINAWRDSASASGIQVQFTSSRFPLRKCQKKHIVELRAPGQEPISQTLDVYDTAQQIDVKFYDLKHSTEYEAFVKSSCDGKLGEDVSAGKIITVPKIPEKVHCSVDENSPSDIICIKWNGEPESVDYEIYVACIDENEAVLIPPNEKESHVYKCQNNGCAYEVKIRAYNASGYSQWSPTKVIITAPAAVDDVRMAFEDKVIVVSWDATRHTAEYDVDLFEVNDDDDTDLLDDEKNKLVYSRNVKNRSEPTHPIDEVLEDFKPRKGVVYQCRITTKNASGVGISKKSKKFISPLDPPTDITHQQKEDTVLLEWKPSVGMKKVKIVVKQGEDHDYQDIVTEDFWTSPPLLPDRHVEIRIYAKNSTVESEEFGQKKFYTAPSLIVADLDPTYRSTYMNVDITSKTDGRYRVHIESLNGDHLDEFETTNLQCQVTDLHPATEYVVVVQNVSDDPEEICLDSHAERVTTDPLQITRLKCEIVDEQQKLLSWDSCGNDQIGYTVECRKDMAVMTTTTTETKMLLESLEPGRYSFLVKGGQGEFSKPYNITVPESPKFEVELLTPEQISVICSQVKYADNYEAEIWCDGNRRDNFATINGKFRIHHAFECAKLYLLKLYAVCKQHKSEVAKHYFYANLTAATNLCYKLDNKQPSKKIRFTWETDDLTLKSHLKLSDCNENVIGEVISVEKEWEFGDLVPNREYTLKAYPNDGVRSYTNYAEVKFRTVPSKPDKLEIKKNRFHPETMFDVEIHADYNGPFMILVKKANEKEGQEIEKDSKRFTLDNMIPGCPYCFFVRCKFTDPVNEIEYYSAYTPFTGKK